MAKPLQINVRTDRRNQFIDITDGIQKAVDGSGVKDGSVSIFVPHTTAAITINENADPSVRADILEHLEKLVPANARYSHSEGNSDAHIKSSLVGVHVSVFISGGKLVLGTWQGVFFCEFDGPRSRKVLVNINPS